jgi:hypothetical protein
LARRDQEHLAQALKLVMRGQVPHHRRKPKLWTVRAAGQRVAILVVKRQRDALGVERHFDADKQLKISPAFLVVNKGLASPLL